MLGKTGAKELEGQWKSIRRGWFVGGEGIREELLARRGLAVVGRRRESMSGEEVRARRGREAGGGTEKG
jgi:hypothetical protein